MRVAALLLIGSLLFGCSSFTKEDYVQDTRARCTDGDQLACQSLASLHPQALLDADAIMQGMQQARLRRELFRRAMP